MSFVDAISIRILNETSILYAKGNKLILQHAGYQHINQKFPFDKIHQISFRSLNDRTYKIACSAGREILVTEIADNEFRNSFVIKMSDWISSIKVLEDELIAVVTAHNHVALLEVQNGTVNVKEKLRCDENSTLYCSFIYGSCWDALTFFGGTALGELVVWKKLNGSPQIVHRQFMHHGVVFAIDFDRSYLVTSSDDRSIKVFNVVSSENSFRIAEKKQLFGHTSRVFVCKIIKFDDRILFVSAGEDSNLCVWSEDGELLAKKNVCASGIIWSLDYHETLEAIVTSSSTGKLNKFKLREILFEKQRRIIINSKAHPAKLRYLNDALIVLDSDMKIHMKLPEQVAIEIEQPESSQKYVAMDLLGRRLFLAAKSSVVIFDYTESTRQLNYTTEIQIKSMLPKTVNLDYLRSVHALDYNLVFVSDASGLCLAINVELKTIQNLFQIPKSVEPWTTAVAMIGDIWLIADRIGNLFLYLSENDGTSVGAPIEKLWRLHGQLGVTNIIVEAEGFIRTTGNDGTVKTLFLDQTANPPTLEVHQCERTSVNWIERVCNWNGKEFLLGFNDNYFVIARNRQIIYEHRCGGRHRHWDVTTDHQGKVNFTYIHKKQITSVEFLLSDFNLDYDDVAWHTKDCNIIEAVHGDLLITGGEDTLMKIMRIISSDGEDKFSEVADVHSHISSIKTIATWQESGDLWIASAGGRAQIVVTRLINMKRAKEEVNFLLANSLQCGSSKDSTFDPETRFTCVRYDESFRSLLVACSDGYVRILKLIRVERCWKLSPFLEHFYGKCILQIHKLRDFILTMATDGCICFWQLNESGRCLKLVEKLKHNQSGINCFDVTPCDDGKFRVATSGDDAGIVITDLTISGSEIKFLRTLSYTDAHTSQVTGLKFISSEVFYTASIDQTICKAEIKDSTISVIDRKFTCISDVKGFLTLNNRKILVYGAGLEALPMF